MTLEGVAAQHSAEAAVALSWLQKWILPRAKELPEPAAELEKLAGFVRKMANKFAEVTSISRPRS